MHHAILSQALVIGQRLAIFRTVAAHWTEIYCGIDIVGRSVLLGLSGIALQLMEVCTAFCSFKCSHLYKLLLSLNGNHPVTYL